MRSILQCGCWLTTIALVFAQGPIIDSDPAPGRSPGPPVNYTPLSAAVEANSGFNAKDGITSSASYSSPPPSQSSTFSPAPPALPTANPMPPVSFPSPHSTVPGNYGGFSATTRRTETPASNGGVGVGDVNISARQRTGNVPDEQNNLSVHGNAHSPQTPTIYNSNNNKSTTESRSSTVGLANSVDGVVSPRKEESQRHQVEGSGDLQEITKRASAEEIIGMPAARVVVAAEEDTLNNSTTRPVTNKTNDAAISSGPTPVTMADDEPSDLLSFRNRRSSNQVTTTIAGPSGTESIERIAVATVPSSRRVVRIMEDDSDGDVRLFCGGAELEKGFFSEPNDVLVKLPSSELFRGSGGDAVAVISRNEGDDDDGAGDVLSGVAGTTKSGRDESLAVENVKVYSVEGTVTPATSYPYPSPSMRRHSTVVAGVESVTRSSIVGAVLSTPSNPPPDHAAEKRHKNGGGKGVPQESHFPSDGEEEGEGLPVLVDVTHGVFDTRSGLVAGLEYQGKCGYRTG